MFLELEARLEADLAAGFLMVAKGAVALVVYLCSTDLGVGPEDSAYDLFLQLSKYFCKPLNAHSYIYFCLNYSEWILPLQLNTDQSPTLPTYNSV